MVNAVLDHFYVSSLRAFRASRRESLSFSRCISTLLASFCLDHSVLLASKNCPMTMSIQRMSMVASVFEPGGKNVCARARDCSQIVPANRWERSFHTLTVMINAASRRWRVQVPWLLRGTSAMNFRLWECASPAITHPSVSGHSDCTAQLILTAAQSDRTHVDLPSWNFDNNLLPQLHQFCSAADDFSCSNILLPNPVAWRPQEVEPQTVHQLHPGGFRRLFRARVLIPLPHVHGSLFCKDPQQQPTFSFHQSCTLKIFHTSKEASIHTFAQNVKQPR